MTYLLAKILFIVIRIIYLTIAYFELDCLYFLSVHHLARWLLVLLVRDEVLIRCTPCCTVRMVLSHLDEMTRDAEEEDCLVWRMGRKDDDGGQEGFDVEEARSGA